MAWCCGGSFPCTSRQPTVGCSLPAHSFSKHGLLFIFSSWSYPATSPGGLGCLSVFAYYKTFGPVSSVIKVKVAPSGEYWSSWHLAQLMAERSTPVLAQRADSDGCPCPCVDRCCGAACPSPTAVFPLCSPGLGWHCIWEGCESFVGLV